MATLTYPAHGWLPVGASQNMQRSDQGEDFVTNWRGAIQAPGNWVCTGVGSDRPFPNGFGPAFALVRITSGPFASSEPYYIGHCTSAVRTGESGAFGHVLAHADQGHNFEGTNGGWVELGQQMPSGQLGPNLGGAPHWFRGLLEQPLNVRIPDPPLKYGDASWRVLFMTKSLWNCGWLARPWFHFNSTVHGAVVAFKTFHHIPMPPIAPKGKPQPDRGIVDAPTAAAIKHSGDWCLKHRRKEKR